MLGCPIYPRMKKAEDIKLRKEVRFCDYFALATFIFMLATRFITIQGMVEITETTATTIREVATAYEGNPLMKYFMILSNLKGMLLIFIVPAIAMALYFYCRRKVLRRELALDTFIFFTLFAFFVFLINIVNDVAFYVGSLI